jgi:PncC family amidohydrolase
VKNEEKLGELLKERGWHIAVAESTTGGLMNHMIITVPGASKYYLGGTITYTRNMKVNILGVPEEVLDGPGSVSEEGAIAMARGALDRTKAEITISETGIAGPIPGRSSKPLGSAYIAVCTADDTICEYHAFEGNRVEVLRSIAETGLRMAVDYLEGKK